jgi:hypothetical protein
LVCGRRLYHPGRYPKIAIVRTPGTRRLGRRSGIGSDASTLRPQNARIRRASNAGKWAGVMPISRVKNAFAVRVTSTGYSPDVPKPGRVCIMHR